MGAMFLGNQINGRVGGASAYTLLGRLGIVALALKTCDGPKLRKSVLTRKKS